MEVLDEDGFPFLTGRRGLAWNGVKYTKIYQGRRLLLKSTNTIFFHLRFSLKSQDLPKPVSLVKYKGRRGMTLGSDLFSVEIPSLRTQATVYTRMKSFVARSIRSGGLYRDPHMNTGSNSRKHPMTIYICWSAF
jgi:hypothetical protein